MAFKHAGITTAAILLAVHSSNAEPVRAKVVSFYGYDDCIRIENKDTRVTFCPAAGGRVLEYTLNGKNCLYLPEGLEGWTWKPGQKGGSMPAGRFDIGPEKIVKPRPLLWLGRWNGEVTGERSARMTSQKDDSTGVQLVRDFELDSITSRLRCKQTIINVSDSPVEYCHWSRTFALGGGIVVIPLSKPSRFPNKYVMYGGHSSISYKPKDSNIREREGFLEVLGTPEYAKLGMDSYVGWLAYLMKNDVLFVKRYPTFPDRVYNEVAGLTISIWYPKDSYACELEPIGPRERLKPGESASFTETWWLLPHKYPEADVDLAKISQLVDANCPRGANATKASPTRVSP